MATVDVHAESKRLVRRADAFTPGGLSGHQNTRFLTPSSPAIVASSAGARFKDGQGREGMNLHSPGGRLPLEIRGIRVRDGHLEIEGAMGTWPTRGEIQPCDVAPIAGRIIPRRSASVLGLGTRGEIQPCDVARIAGRVISRRSASVLGLGLGVAPALRGGGRQ